ncbi:MAG: 30S ribosomal protein S12 methylthiotransferase RimO [Planctomycetota bacterium]
MSTPVSLVHLGCARNLIDSELILARLAEEGLVVAGRVEDARIAVLNTCSFIGPARKESEDAIRSLVKRKRRGELDAVVVAGCLVQRFQRTLEARFPDVDLFAEISDYSALASAVHGLTTGASVPRYLAAGGLRAAEREGSRLLSTPGSYAYMRISHGCDHLCAFCAIPGIRGKHRSKSLEALVAEAIELRAAGVAELVLVAEDSTAWGRDLGRDVDLSDLVRALADLPGGDEDQQPRIRIMYAYPHRFPWGLAELLRDHPRVVPYIDIPTQHVSTPVLRAMRRAGSGEAVREILDRLREEVPGLTLRSTLLVGFPGETEADIELLSDFVESYGLGRLGAFTYSEEEGTHGASLPDDVPEDVKAARLARVLAARDNALRAGQTALAGTTLEVLVDESHLSVEDDGEPSLAYAVGRTPMDAPEVDPFVVVLECEAPIGSRLAVTIESVDDEFNLIGRPA